MSRRKKKGHSQRTQPWFGKTRASIGVVMERTMLGSVAREQKRLAHEEEERLNAEYNDAWVKHQLRQFIPVKAP